MTQIRFELPTPAQSFGATWFRNLAYAVRQLDGSSVGVTYEGDVAVVTAELSDVLLEQACITANEALEAELTDWVALRRDFGSYQLCIDWLLEQSISAGREQPQRNVRQGVA